MSIQQGPQQSLYSNYNPSARPNQAVTMPTVTQQSNYNSAYNARQNQHISPRPQTNRYRQASPRPSYPQRPASSSNLSVSSFSQSSPGQNIALPSTIPLSQNLSFSRQTEEEVPVFSNQFSISNDQPSSMVDNNKKTKNPVRFPQMSVIQNNGSKD